MSLVKTNKSRNTFPSLFNSFFENDAFLTNGWFEKELNQSLPALNITETTNEFAIELAAPGYNKSDFKITSEEGVLTITAEKQEETNNQNKRFTRKEFSYENFTRSLKLPENSLPDKIDARYENGLLKLILPKKEIKVSPVKKEIKVA
jgi:HSP20 family protein